MYIKKYLVFFVLVIVGFNQLNAQLNPQFVGMRPYPNGTIEHILIFDSTGSVQGFLVPTGVTSLWVEVNGAQGGKLTGSTASFDTSGMGGRVKAKLAVTPGDSLYIFVGGKPPLDSRAPAPMGGGGNGGTNYSNSVAIASAGGGYSAITTANIVDSARILVIAGGGGGQSIKYHGGKGGGLEGKRGDCRFWEDGIEGGVGGTQTKGGNKGKRYSPDWNVDAGWALSTGYPDEDLTKVPAAGRFLKGGNGGSVLSPTSHRGGGGGGGGWYGGGGGAGGGNSQGGGGGGSSWTNPDLAKVSYVRHYQGQWRGNGRVIIIYYQ
jgi:hypothetical protein